MYRLWLANYPHRLEYLVSPALNHRIGRHNILAQIADRDEVYDCPKGRDIRVRGESASLKCTLTLKLRNFEVVYNARSPSH
jgi:transposase